MRFYQIFPYLFQGITRPIVKKILEFFCNLEVHGLEVIDNIDSNFILASQHEHELDGFLLPATIPLSLYAKPIFPVSRESEFYADKGLRGKILYGGNFFKFMGAYPAYAGQRNYSKSLQNQIDILNDDQSILIFPAGKVGHNQAKGGVGYLALKTGKPVIPVKLRGVKGMSMGELFSFQRKMEVTFMKPVHFESEVSAGKNIPPKDCKAVAKKVGDKLF